MRTSPRILGFALRVLLPCAAALLASALPACAQSHVSGTYDCKTMEVGGKTAPCKAPSLELKSDGSYQILDETGSYEIVAGRWLSLTTKKRGKARLNGKEIIFEFVSHGKKSRIIYRRKFERTSGSVAI